MQMRARDDGDPLIRVGFTATKKVGGAVVRNRAKRRLREAARLISALFTSSRRRGHGRAVVPLRAMST